MITGEIDHKDLINSNLTYLFHIEHAKNPKNDENGENPKNDENGENPKNDENGELIFKKINLILFQSRRTKIFY